MFKFNPGDKIRPVDTEKMTDLTLTVEYSFLDSYTGRERVKCWDHSYECLAEWFTLVESCDTVIERYLREHHHLFKTATELAQTATPQTGVVVLQDEILDTSVDAMPPSFLIEIGDQQPFDYPEDDESRERQARAKLVEYKRGMRDLLYGTTSAEPE